MDECYRYMLSQCVHYFMRIVFGKVRNSDHQQSCVNCAFVDHQFCVYMRNCSV